MKHASPARLLYFFLAALTILRLVLAAHTELSPDEAYYSMWAERLDISYYSKGPGVAATMWAGTHLLGLNELGIRVFSPLLSLGTSLLVFRSGAADLLRLGRHLVGADAAKCADLSCRQCADDDRSALDLLLTAALWTVWRALEESGRFTWWWPATGALIGAGFLCKYTNAMQLLCVLLLLVSRQSIAANSRASASTRCCCGVSAIHCAADHLECATRLDHARPPQRARRSGEGVPHRSCGVLYLLGSTSVHTRRCCLRQCSWAGGGAWRKARHSLRHRFLLAFALPLWAMYLWLALKQAGEANWTAPAMVSLGILAVACWHERAQTSPALRRTASRLSRSACS
jgi:4-amino-4-deoxy-L-arabinose transferase-like glycosyltransferase